MTDVKDVKNTKGQEKEKEPIEPHITEVIVQRASGELETSYLISEDKNHEKTAYRVYPRIHSKQNRSKTINKRLPLTIHHMIYLTTFQNTFSFEDFLVSLYHINDISQTLKYNVYNAKPGFMIEYPNVERKYLKLVNNRIFMKSNFIWHYYDLTSVMTLQIENEDYLYYENKIYAPLEDSVDVIKTPPLVDSKLNSYKGVTVVIMANANNLLQGFIGTLTGTVELYNTVYIKQFDIYIIGGPIVGIFELRCLVSNNFYLSMETSFSDESSSPDPVPIGELIRSSFIPFLEKPEPGEYPVIDKESKVLTYITYYNEKGKRLSQENYLKSQQERRALLSEILISDLVNIVQGYDKNKK